MCSKCGDLLDKQAPFKLNEYQYEVVCLDCDAKFKFSRNKNVDYTSPLKQRLLSLISDSKQKNRTLTLNNKVEKRTLVEYLSTKVKYIPNKN